jgi:hypothetical protein
VPARLVGLLSAGALFLLLSGAARHTLEAPGASRYLYLGAVVVLLVCAEVLRDVRLGPRVVAAFAVVVAFAVFSQIAPLQAGAGSLRVVSEAMEAELAVVELLADRAAPAYEPDPQRAPGLVAGDYLHQVRANGSSPAESIAEVVRDDAEPRREADRVLREMNALKLEPAPPPPARPSGPCAPELRTGPGPVVVVAGRDAPAEVRVRRFSAEHAEAPLAVVPAGEARLLRLPPDAAARIPWHVEARGAAARACTARA